jgi:tetratricopeptide (TPR) repeat protein
MASERPCAWPRVLAFFVALVLACAAGCAHSAPTRDSLESDRHAPADALYRAGLALAARGDLTRSEQYLALAHRQAGLDRASLIALLAVCVRAQRLRSAIAHAEPYLREHPGERPLLALVATLHLALGELAQAEQLCLRVLRLDEAHAATHYLLARVYAARLGGSGGSRRDQTAHARAMRRHLARYLALTPEGSHAEEVRVELANAHATPRTGS